MLISKGVKYENYSISLKYDGCAANESLGRNFPYQGLIPTFLLPKIAKAHKILIGKIQQINGKGRRKEKN